MPPPIVLRLPLDLKCPECDHIGVWLVIELSQVSVQGDLDGALVPVSVECANSDCDRTIDYGHRMAELG